jgi:DNA-binding XRE family transcriptional regulator
MGREIRKRRNIGRTPFSRWGPSGLKTAVALPAAEDDATVSSVGKSSIAKQLHVGAGSAAAWEVGRRVRARRLAIGMTQSELAAPLSRGFVSAVEKGQALPSLGSLWLFAARLGTAVGDLVDGVNGVETPEYTRGNGSTTTPAQLSGRDRNPSSSGRR